MPTGFAKNLKPGDRVAITDGAGAPTAVLGALADAAEGVGGIDLLLGWCLSLDATLLRESAFRDIRTIMAGYGLRRPVREGRVGYVPTRLGGIPALLNQPLRPNVLVASVRPCPGGFAWCSEVGWAVAAAERARVVLGVVNEQLPITSGEPVLPADRVTVVAEVDAPPGELAPPSVDELSRAIGASVAELVPRGAAIQMGPGKIAAATLEALTEPVHVRTGVIGDSVLGLAERGLLLDEPETAYVVGSNRLYEWADGRTVSRRVEYTHDVTRLATLPFFAINTALEIDAYGQVNVERIGDDPVGGVGGHGDFAFAASRSVEGLSIIALPRVRGGRPTLVDPLTVPASTGFPDVDVVVCEAGRADLRGLTSAQRRDALTELWSR